LIPQVSFPSLPCDDIPRGGQVRFKGSRQTFLRSKDHPSADIGILKQNPIDGMNILSVNRKVLEAKFVVLSSRSVFAQVELHTPIDNFTVIISCLGYWKISQQ
jgi:hypothetical protein